MARLKSRGIAAEAVLSLPGCKPAQGFAGHGDFESLLVIFPFLIVPAHSIRTRWKLTA
jgi:hypothetical protein